MRPRLKISIAALAGSLVVSFILWVAFIALCVKLGRAWGWL